MDYLEFRIRIITLNIVSLFIACKILSNLTKFLNNPRFVRLIASTTTTEMGDSIKMDEGKKLSKKLV